MHHEDWGINETYGLSRRFLAAKGAVNEIILHHDDDLILPERTLDRLLSHYQRRPNVIHSLFGRRPSLSLQYLYEDVTGDVLIALTGCSLVSKKLVEHCLGRYFQETHNFMRQSNFKTLWNGEDIYQSLVAFKHSGLLNKAYALPCVYLNSVLGNSMAISNNPDHLVERSELLRYAVEKMDLVEQVTEFLRSTSKSASRISAQAPAETRQASKHVRSRRFIKGKRKEMSSVLERLKELKTRLVVQVIKSKNPPVFFKRVLLTLFYMKHSYKWGDKWGG